MSNQNTHRRKPLIIQIYVTDGYLTFYFTVTPFAVSVEIVRCAAPWFSLVSSNAVMIDHIVINKRELATSSISVPAVCMMAT